MKETLHIYCRVSTRVQEKGASLDTQEKLGKKKAKELGYEYQVWNEGGASSHHEEFNNRPVLRALLKDIEGGLVRHLFVYNNDRLSRNEHTQYIIKKRLTDNEVRLYTKDGAYDLNNHQDKFVKGIMDGLAQYNNAITAERSREGKTAKVGQGGWHGGHPPFGYQIEDKRLVIHPVESEWVKKMFEWYYEGRSIMWIKTQLDIRGVLSRRGKLFATGSLDRLLKNTHHKGYYTYTDHKDDKTITVTIPAIVDETIWNGVQERRRKVAARNSQNNRTKKFYLLRNLLVCEECGSKMSGRISDTDNYNLYFCPSKQTNWRKGALPKDKKWKRGKVGEHGCSMVRSLNIPITDKFVWDLVIDTVSNSSILKERTKVEVLDQKFKGDRENERLLDKQREKSKRLMKQLKRVQSSIAEVETKNLLDEYDDAEIYSSIKSKLVAELKKVKDDIEQTRIAIRELGNQKKWLDWVEKYGDDLRLKNDLSKEDKKVYLEDLIEKIGVRLDKETNDHHLTINFHMGLVGDGIQYADEMNKSDGYELIEGDRRREMVISKEYVQQMHREKRVSGRHPKKKAGWKLPNQVTVELTNSVTVE